MTVGEHSTKTGLGLIFEVSVNYQFGHFFLRSDRRELLKDGNQVSVQPKAFDLLLYLLEHRDRAVSKEEILNALWPNIHVSETALTRCIMKARRAVDDDADQQSTIQTVHGHGYRFAADAMEQTEADVTVTNPVSASSASKTSRLPIAILGCLVLLVGVFASFQFFTSDAAVRNFRVAVLPVDNATGDPDLDWTELGLMSLVDNYLSVEAGFKTVSSADVLKFSDNNSKLDEDTSLPNNIAQRLLRTEGATHVVAAELSKENDVFSMRYFIVRPNGVQSEYSLIGAAPVELARQLSGSIVSSLHNAQVSQIQKVVSEDTFVEEAFARGRALQLRGKDASALNLYEAALEQEPDNFWTNFYLAIGMRNLGENEEAENRFLTMINELDVKEEPQKANALHEAIGYLYYSTGDIEKSKLHYEQSLEYAMSTKDRRLVAHALRDLGTAADYNGDFDIARDYFHRALTEYLAIGVSPPPAELLTSFAILEAGEGNYFEAARYFEMGLERHRVTGNIRSVMIAHGNLAFLHYSRGDWEKSNAFFTEALKLSRELEDPTRIAFNLIRWSKLKVDEGRFDEAEQLNAEALTVVRKIANKRLEAFALKNIATLHHKRKEYAEALEYFGNQKALYQALDDVTAAQAATISIARVKLDQGDLADAQSDTEAALTVIRTEKKGPEIDALELIGDIRIAQGDIDGGIALIEEAHQIAKSERDGLSIARLSARLGESHLQKSNVTQASAYLVDAQEVHPELPYVLKLTANLAFENGHGKEATKLMKRAKEKYGDNWSQADEARLMVLSNEYLIK